MTFKCKQTFWLWNYFYAVVQQICLCLLTIYYEAHRHSFYSLQRQVKEMNSLQSDFTKHLATADSSLLQTNVALELMSKSHEVEAKLVLWKIKKHLNYVSRKLWDRLTNFFSNICLLGGRKYTRWLRVVVPWGRGEWCIFSVSISII